MFRKIFSFSNATLLVALALSTIAAWYSIVGLTAIFAGAVVPIIIMGTALEFGKVVTTVWLRKYWNRASFILKSYLVPAVFFLAVLTSMGIFGFLSKAHMDQGIVSGDAIAKVQLYDEKIAIQKDIVKSSKSMLAQMDMQVNDIMTKGDSERSVERSVAIRKQQAKERASLQKDIENANKEIQKLNEERAPLAAETRKIEAEVGPIKYIAALIYGDNPDQNILERAVRWVIILLVAVFDPLALMLVIAANQSKEWDDNIEEETKLKEEVEHEKVVAELEAERPVIITEAPDEQPEEDLTEINHELAEAAVHEEPFIEVPEEPVEDTRTIFEKHPYLLKPFTHFEGMRPMASTIKDVNEIPDEVLHAYDDERLVTNKDKEILAFGVDVVDRPGDYLNSQDIPEIVEVHVKHEQPQENGPDFEGVKVGDEWVQTGPAFVEEPPVVAGDYIQYDNKTMHKSVFAKKYPDLFLREDFIKDIKTDFGVEFPLHAGLGDTYVRTDLYPNTLYKFNGAHWIKIDKELSSSYLDDSYLEFLISKIATGEYDPELLTQNEQDAIADHIKHKKG